MDVSVAQAQLFFLAFTRIMAIIIHIPMLGGPSVPAQVRIALGLVLAATLIAWNPLPPEVVPIGLFGFAAGIFREIVIGTLAGFAAALAFAAVQIAAEAMGLGSGFSSGQIFNPTFGDSGSAFDQLFTMVAVLFFLIVNGHHFFLMALQRTFLVVPLNGPIETGSLEVLVRTTAQLFTAGVHLALPVLSALLLTDLVLGLLARVAPNIQVYFLGLPLKVG
ncbi:MAG TPA: flagellar biosynthetic protein FliR, partial [Anaerolineaceae bacterium]|nr:flagellar biosynthetic protein FliR [Anaerolineaceae bacterium]